MKRFTWVFLFLALSFSLGCGSGSGSAPTDGASQAEIDAHDAAVDEAEKAQSQE